MVQRGIEERLRRIECKLKMDEDDERNEYFNHITQQLNTIARRLDEVEERIFGPRPKVNYEQGAQVDARLARPGNKY